MPYSNAAAKLSVNRILKSCDGQTITVRTSGYASFASALTPTGNGTFIGIASQYGTTMQLLLRQVSDAALSGSLCSSGGGTTSPGTYLSKDFNDNSLSSGGWTNLRVSGAVDWTVSAFGGQTFAKISNYIRFAKNANDIKNKPQNYFPKNTINYFAALDAEFHALFESKK